MIITLSWYLIFLGECDFNMTLIKQESAGIKMLYLIYCRRFNRKFNVVSNVMGLIAKLLKSSYLQSLDKHFRVKLPISLNICFWCLKEPSD